MTLRAMILAAGFGTRLQPITNTLPKPLIPVAGVPNIERVIGQLQTLGITDVVINLHHLGHRIVEELGDGSPLGVHIEYSREPTILGTGGGIKQAAQILPGDTLLVVNGDILFSPDLEAALISHRERNALATLVVRPDPEALRLGVVGLDRSQRVRRLVSTGLPVEEISPFMFTGVHILEQEILKSLPNNGCVVRSTYMPLVESGAPIYGFPDSSHFCDLGMPARYLEAHVGMLKGIFPMRGYRAPASGIVIDPSARIGSDVRIEPGTAIGPGAEIENNCTLRESIVLPGARVTESLHRQIALASGEVITPDSNL